MKSPLLVALLVACPFLALAQFAQDQPPGQGEEEEDPFARSQMEEPVIAGSPAAGGMLFTVRGFVDAGFIDIAQTGPAPLGGDLSWAFGNSQFTFFAGVSTFTVNEVDLTLEADRERDGLLLGGRASIDYYPSRDTEAYQLNTDRPFDVDEAFVFVEFLRAWNTRIVLGRAPGFVTLEQQEAESPDLRLIGHTYVFQAGGGYPYGLQVHTRPLAGLAVKLGYSNGGVGSYGFFQGDDSTLNRPDADTNVSPDSGDRKTVSAAVEWVPFDRPAEAGTLTLGLAGADNPKLTFNPVTERAEPYSFSNFYGAYRLGAFEVRAERAELEAFYEGPGTNIAIRLGRFEATMAYLLLTYFLGSDHTFTLRGERIEYVTDRNPAIEGEATKYGLTYRYRFDDPMVLKVEAVRETQSPQFFVATEGQDLTTEVFTTSWVYAF